MTKYKLLIRIISIALSLALGVLVACQEQKDNISYYPNGKIKYSYQTQNRLQNGITIFYYPNGEVQSKCSWVRGKQDGPSHFYYPDGKLKNVSMWKLGVPDGLSKTFYKNGIIKEESFWKNGKMLGDSYEYYPNGKLKKKAYVSAGTAIRTVVLYDSEGKPKEKHIENEDGQLIYVASFDQNGKVEPGLVVPIFQKKSDTITINQAYNVIMRFGFKINNKTKLVIKYNNKNDTLSFIPNRRGEAYSISLKPVLLGQNDFDYKLHCLDCEEDSLIVDGVRSSHSFFVKNNP